MTGHNEWPLARITALKAMWFDGKSYNECAAHFGVSRGTIAGQVHRRGWRAREKGQKPGQRINPNVAKPKPPKTAKPMPEPVAPKASPPIGGVPFMLTTSRQCLWPIEAVDRPAHAMMPVCGSALNDPDDPKCRYCVVHKRMAGGYVPRRIRPPYEAGVIRAVI